MQEVLYELQTVLPVYKEKPVRNWFLTEETRANELAED